MKWTWPFGNTQRDSKSAFPLALLSEPRAANWGARDAGALIRDGYLRNAVAYRRLTLAEVVTPPGRVRSLNPGAPPPEAPVFAEADLVVIDGPTLSGVAGGGPLVAAFSEPWPGEIAVLAGPYPDDLRLRARLPQPAVIGRLTAPAGVRPGGRWDRSTRLEVEAPAGVFTSLAEGPLLAGGNTALLETMTGWELLQFRQAELTGPGNWRLTDLLRGQAGSVSGAAETGARLVLMDSAVQRAEVSALETGMDLIWKAAGSSETQTLGFDSRETLPWQPCHLRTRGGLATWQRRARDIPDSWTFPEAPNTGRFAVEFDFGAGFEGRIETEAPSCAVPDETVSLRVAEIRPDGRTGPWLSIGPGSPYL